MRIPEIEDLKKHAESGKSLPVVLVAGGDDAVRDGVEGVLSEDLSRTGVTISTVRLDAGPARSDACERFAEVTDNPSLFGEGFVVTVSNCDAAKVSPELGAFLESPSGHVRLALYGDRKAARSGLGKAVARVGKVIAPKDVRERDAVRLVSQAARDAGLRLEGRTAMALVDLVGGDRGAIGAAIESLLDYKGPGGTLREGDLRGLVTRTSKPKPWDLDDAVAARDLGRCLKIAIRNLDDSSQPGRILNTLVRLARRMLIAKDLVERKVSTEDSMERLGIGHPFPWQRIREASARYGKGELESFLRDVPRLELLVKRGHATDEAVLTSVLTNLVGRK